MTKHLKQKTLIFWTSCLQSDDIFSVFSFESVFNFVIVFVPFLFCVFCLHCPFSLHFGVWNQILLHFDWPVRYMYLSLSILLNLSLTFFVFVPFFFFISFLCNQMLLHFEWPARYLLQRTEFKSERACCQSSSTYSCKEYLKYL